MYIGFLEAGTTEQEQNNCMIMKIEKIGNITTRKYAKGINYEKTCTWSERANLDYKFKLKNL